MWCYLDSAWEHFDSSNKSLVYTPGGSQRFYLLGHVLFQVLVGYLLAKG